MFSQNTRWTTKHYLYLNDGPFHDPTIDYHANSKQTISYIHIFVKCFMLIHYTYIKIKIK